MSPGFYPSASTFNQSIVISLKNFTLTSLFQANLHFWVRAHHTFQQMLQINGRFLGWPKKYLLCSRCDAGVGHASKPNSVHLAAGVTLQGYRLGGWSSSPAQLCRNLLMGRAGGQGQPQPTFTVWDRGVHWSLSASPDTSPLSLGSVRTKPIAAVRWSFSKSVLHLEESTLANERSRFLDGLISL